MVSIVSGFGTIKKALRTESWKDLRQAVCPLPHVSILTRLSLNTRNPLHIREVATGVAGAETPLGWTAVPGTTLRD